MVPDLATDQVSTCAAQYNSSGMLAPLLFAGLASVAYGRTPESQVLEIDQKGFNVLDTVLPPSAANVTSVRTALYGYVPFLRSNPTRSSCLPEFQKRKRCRSHSMSTTTNSTTSSGMTRRSPSSRARKAILCSTRQLSGTRLPTRSSSRRMPVRERLVQAWRGQTTFSRFPSNRQLPWLRRMVVEAWMSCALMPLLRS